MTTPDTITLPVCSTTGLPVDKIVMVDESAIGGSIDYELVCDGKVVPITRADFDQMKTNRTPAQVNFSGAPTFTRKLVGQAVAGPAEE